MKEKIVIILFMILIGSVLFSQNRGGISEDMLKKIKNNFKKDGKTIAIINAVSNNDIKKLAVRRDNTGVLDHEFSNRVDVKGITDQKSSGRCWLFTGQNVLRPIVMRKYKLEEFEFSRSYTFFYDQLEKSNLFLEAIIATSDKPLEDRNVEWLFKNTIGDGGVWSLFADVTKKYGIVPLNAMPESYNTENTAMLNRILNSLLKQYGLELRKMSSEKKSIDIIENRKLEMLSDVYRILVICMGEPPSDFVYKYKDKNGNKVERKFTPKEFYDKFVGVDLDDYILLMNDPSREYYRLYEIEYDRNMYDGNNWRYINVPIEDIKEFAKKSILDNEAMYMSCDVGKFLDKDKGTLDINNYDYESLFGVKFNMDKKERIITYESGSSHAMTLVGVDIDSSGKIRKWQVENSWGSNSGNKGYLTITDEWFSEYLFRLVVLKKYVSDRVLEVLKQKPVKLPPWDPMFLSED